MKNIAAYIRVSSDKQDVARQRESIEHWSQTTNTPIDQWFEDSEGKNPRDQAHKRQGFQKLFRAVEAGLVSSIIVDRQDRFGARDAHQWGAFLTRLRDNGCTLVEASTGKDLSADDEVAILTGTLGAITSTREQKEKAHRNVSGKVPKARRGEYQGGNPPYGCDVVCFGADGNEKWRSVYVGHYQRWKVYPNGDREKFDGKNNSPRKDPTDTFYLRPSIESERVTTVQQIFKWYAHEAVSFTQIATRLNELGISPVFGEHWHKVTVRQLLQNPAYIGLPAWNKKASSRFAEFVNGQIRAVEQKNGKARLGRRRDTKDFSPKSRYSIPSLTWRLGILWMQSSTDHKAAPKNGRQRRTNFG
jgi:site-specific DNA recombinase